MSEREAERLDGSHQTPEAGTTLAGLRRLLSPYWQWLVTGFPPDVQVDPADIQAFREHNHRELRRTIYLLGLLLMTINLGYWFTDAWVFRDSPEVLPIFDRLRASFSAAGIVTLLAQKIPGLSAYISGILGGTLICLSGAHHMALLGGPGTPWFHFLYPFVMIVLIAWATPLVRIGATGLMASAILGGYFGLHPPHLADPLAFMAIGYFGYILILCYALGLYTDNNRLRLFLANREVARTRDALNRRVMEQSIILSGLHARLDTLRDVERKTLAQDLHDELGQLLTAQRMVLESTRQRYRQKGASIEPNLATLESLLDRFSTHFRSQLNSLRPPVLEGGDLRAVLRTLVDHWSLQAGIPCPLVVPADALVLDAERAGVLYRFVQEALTNVARHASARQVQVSVEVKGGWLIAQVRDDGVGMRLNTPDSSHMGLSGIRERVQAIQGELEIDSTPGTGTSLRIDFPLMAMDTASPFSPTEDTLP